MEKTNVRTSLGCWRLVMWVTLEYSLSDARRFCFCELKKRRTALMQLMFDIRWLQQFWNPRLQLTSFSHLILEAWGDWLVWPQRTAEQDHLNLQEQNLTKTFQKCNLYSIVYCTNHCELDDETIWNSCWPRADGKWIATFQTNKKLRQTLHNSECHADCLVDLVERLLSAVFQL